MRKNHHGKNDRLVKRVFALCLALAVICTCLVPVFATEDLSDLQVEKGASQPVDGEGGKEEAAGFGGEEAPRPVDDEGGEEEAAGSDGDSPAVDDSEAAGSDGDSPAVDDSEAAGSDGDSPAVDDSEAAGSDGEEASQPVDGEGGEDNPGEDDVVEKPDDKVVVSGDEIKKPQDMVVYRFWLKELNADVLKEITAQAQINNMTESEYLAQKGEAWKLYFIQAVPRAETIADYSSYIKNPSSNQDPEGMLRLFDYWYTLDEFDNRVRLNLTDPTSNILDDKTTTVNVYAEWKDGTVGSDEEEDVVHEDLVDENPVPPAPVELTAKAAATYKGEGDNTESVDLPVEVKNLPSAAHSLSVIRMGYDDVGDFYEKHSNDFEGMAPLLGLEISPKNASGDTVQLAEGEKATVTVSGLDKLPAMEGATASTLKVLHQKDDNTVEKLDVVSYENGTLTFKTTSFSPFVLVLAGGYDTELLDDPVMSLSVEDRTYVINVEQNVKIDGVRGYNNNSWSSSDSSIVSIEKIQGNSTSINAVGEKAGTATLTHTYYYWGSEYSEKFTVIVNGTDSAAVYFLFDPEKIASKNDNSEWAGVLTYNGSNATVDTTNATWGSGENDNQSLNYKNIKTNVNSYITMWPDGETSGTSNWVLDETARETKVSNTQNGVTKSDTVENFVFNNYKSKLQKLGLPQETINNLEPKDITITLVPYKISRSNSTDPDKHIDCNVVVTCDKTFTAKFHVLKPGEKNYEEVSSKVYLDDNKVQKYTGTDALAEIVYDGATWKFDGWYPENKVGDGPDEDNGVIPDTEWPYAVQKKQQLENHNKDRVVNFYAHYTKVTADLTVSKTVTGKLGDTNKAFTFTITKADDTSANITEANIESTDSAKVEWLGNGKFTLKDGATITFKNLPSGQYKIVEDDYKSEKYDTSYKVGSGTSVVDSGTSTDGREATVTIDKDAKQIDFTNHRTLEPDTGVLLDTLPYIVILAVVAGGVALLMLRKRRKEDD